MPGTISTRVGILILLSISAAACRSAAPPETSPLPSPWPIETAPAADDDPSTELTPVSLMPVPTASETSPPEPSGETAELLASEDQGSALFTEPSPDAAVVTALVSGDRLQVLEAQRSEGGNVWYFARVGESEGWVEGKFVNFSEAYASTSRPFVVLPGGASVYTEPDSASEVLQKLDGGSVVVAEQRYYNDGVWFYSGGWMSGEELFRPACIEFNGYLPLVVAPGGTTVHSTAAYQIPVENKLTGGELVFPSEATQNSTGTWFKTDQGWVSGQSMFYPFCETASPET